MSFGRHALWAAVAVLQSAFALSCTGASNSGDSSTNSDAATDAPACPWAGQGEATVMIDDPSSPILGGIGDCASGAYLNPGNNDRELQVCSTVFDFNVSIGPNDTTTGARPLAPQGVVDGTSRLTFIAMTPTGMAIYQSAPDGIGTVTLTSNFESSGQPFEGTFSHVHMTLHSCTTQDCTSYPQTLSITGHFFGVAR